MLERSVFFPRARTVFSLIVTLIAVALVAALAAVTLYFGADSLQRHQSNASAARAVNESNQVRAAATMFANDHGREAQTLDELVAGNYLNANLRNSGWESVDGTVQLSQLSTDQCTVINSMMGVSGIPACDDPRFLQRAICCDGSATPPATP